jgi:hypothetical protein
MKCSEFLILLFQIFDVQIYFKIMYLMQLYVHILLGSVLVYSKTTVKEVEVTDDGYNSIDLNGNFDGKKVHSNEKGFVNDDSNSVESWKKSLMDFMGSKRDELGICFGSCISNGQCYHRSGGNHKCRCTFFSCQLTK